MPLDKNKVRDIHDAVYSLSNGDELGLLACHMKAVRDFLRQKTKNNMFYIRKEPFSKTEAESFREPTSRDFTWTVYFPSLGGEIAGEDAKLKQYQLARYQLAIGLAKVIDRVLGVAQSPFRDETIPRVFRHDGPRFLNYFAKQLLDRRQEHFKGDADYLETGFFDIPDAMVVSERHERSGMDPTTKQKIDEVLGEIYKHE